jgi:hypothetical protein
MAAAVVALAVVAFSQVHAQDTPVEPKVWAGKYIHAEVVGDFEIADSTFHVDLPLASFLAGGEVLTATTAPNSASEYEIGPCIEWASGEDGTGYMAWTTLWLPDWIVAASMESVELLCRSTEEATTTSTVVDFDFLINGDAVIDATAIDNATATLVMPATSGCTAILTLPITSAAPWSGGQVATFRLWRESGSDTFRVYAVRFVGRRGR